MLKKSKSEYFIKRLFTYLDERIKLEIIKYNNNIQKILCINLTNYKFFSKKYTIFEKNGKMKEYSKFSDILIYEGEHLNGKRNGKGKEYYYFNGLLKYEGEYLNGKRNGKGKEYDTCGNLVFAGEYINGNEWNGTLYDKVNNIGYPVKNGKGFIKIYYDLDKLFFEGECLKGRMNRKVKEYYDDGKLSFEGEYRNGRPWNGKGYDKNKNLLYMINNGNGYIKLYDYYYKYLKFEGEYVNGRIIGKVKKYYNEGKLKFEGEYLYDEKKNGKLYINDKLEYEGEFFCEKKWKGEGYNQNGDIIYKLNDGTGKVKEYNYNDDNLLFEGEYINGEKNGKGKEYFLDGNLKFEGEFLKGKKWDGKGYNKNGKIIYELNNGNGKIKEYYYDYDNLEFVGEYIKGEKNGKGKEYYFNGNLKFEGEYLNGERNGKGKEYLYHNGKLEFEGEYLNGERNGKGKEYYYNGNLKFEGEYLNGVRNGKGKEYYYNGNLEFEGEYINGKRK